MGNRQLSSLIVCNKSVKSLQKFSCWVCKFSNIFLAGLTDFKKSNLLFILDRLLSLPMILKILKLILPAMIKEKEKAIRIKRFTSILDYSIWRHCVAATNSHRSYARCIVVRFGTFIAESQKPVHYSLIFQVNIHVYGRT